MTESLTPAVSDRLSQLSPAQRRVLLHRLLEERAAEPEERIPRREAGPAPLSFAQRRLWFIDRLMPGSPTYTMLYSLRVRGPLDEATLVRALTALVARHEVLRTTFRAADDGEPVQVVGPPASFPLPRVELRHLSPAAAQAQALRVANAEAVRPFSLERGPLLRAVLVRLGADEHVLVTAMHHIVSDGWSVTMMLREVATLYRAYAAGGEPDLPPLPLQYADYAAWQRERLSGPALDAELDWWKARLEGAPPRIELPTDRPVGAVRSERAGARSFELPPAASRALAALARREGATPYMLFLAAWQALLARYGAQEDMVVGMAVAGRTRPELEGLVGLFANLLPLRADLSGDPAFVELLARVREATLAAQYHQELPLERLVEALGTERTLAHAPLVQVMFGFSQMIGGGAARSLGGATLEPFGVGSANNPFQLNLTLEEDGGRVSGTLAFQTALFDAATIERMLEHFRTLLEGVAADPRRRVSELPLLAPAERARLLERWSGAAAPARDADQTLPALFAARAAATPGATAIVAPDGRLTYAELDAAANRLARHLRRRGARPGDRVGVCVERGGAAVVAMLAVVKAGAAYVPLDPAWPAGRLALLLGDAAVGVVVTTAALAERLAAAPAVVRLDADAGAIAGEDAGGVDATPGPEAVAYVMYTSGSTGAPKGVAVPHRAVARLVRGARWVSLGGGETILQLAPLAFDASTFEVWGALLNGGRLAVFPPGTPSLGALARFIREQGVTTLWLTAGVFHLMADADAAAFRGVRQLLAGGDVLSPGQVRRVLEACPGLVVINGYGPTENTTFTATAAFADPAAVPTPLPIGAPVRGTTVYVLDAAMRPAPAGVAGELYAGGVGLAHGYAGRPGLTARRFVPHPWGAPGERLYRTGDRVRWRADGRLEFLGRLDRQVKLRGFRVEPGETEAALLALAEVRDAVAVVREDAPGDRRLVAYAVLREGAAPRPAALLAELAGRLPDYQVPSALVLLPALPLTPNGKVDRGALPHPDLEGPGGGGAPRTPTEEIVAGIWGTLLGRGEPGAHDDFFALGGHSLLAMQAVARLRAAFGVEMPLLTFFEAPTVAGVAASVDRLLRGGAAGAVPPVEPAPRRGPLPLSFAQARLWFLDRLEPGSTAYHVPYALRLSGPLHAAALARALRDLAARHESLRTRFPAPGGEPVQVIGPPAPVPLPRVDLAALPAAARTAVARRLAQEEAARPFDLARGPLFRAALLALGEDDHVVLLTLHHAVTDGWSMGVIARELSALYAAHRAGRAPALAPPPLQYADFAAWQRAWLAGPVLEAEVAWWKARLAGAPPLLELPTDRPRAPGVGAAAGVVEFGLPPGLSDALRETGRREGATLFMVLLAAWQALLARYAGHDDVVVGTPVAGRTLVELEGVVGLFVNTLALRTDLSGDPDAAALLARVRETTLGAWQHQHLPFERLVDELGVERSLSHPPLVQVMLTLERADRTPPLLEGVRAESFEPGRAGAKFDLDLGFTDHAGQALGGVLQYRAALFDAATAERMLRHLRTLLEAVAAGGPRRLSQVALLSPPERAQVLGAWNDTAVAFPDGCIHALVSAQAARTPGATAVVATQEVTYAELEARANRLARLLRARGVGAEARVGVCMERSVEMVVALLGVLKAGGAYVPVDPAWPAERIAWMLDDCAVALVLTQAATDAAVAGAAPTFAVDARWAEAQARSAAAPEWEVDPAQLAYVIYTSGSTGRPKGAMNAHRGVVNRLLWMQAEYGLGPGDAVLQKTPFSFDVSVWELFWPLLSGARLVMARPDGHRDPVYLSRVIERERVTTVHFVPSMLRAFLESGQPGRCRTLARVICSGEALSPELAGRCRARLPWAALHNLYGPTEAAVDVSYWPCAAGDLAVPIGRPVANTRLYVRDASGLPAPPAMAGELCIGGVQVGRGYLGRPALTAERFVPDPFGGEPGARLYRTGDRARWRPDGALEYLGRLDHQVKIRGFRVEPGEVEAALRAAPGVADAVVVAREDAPGDVRLAGYVTGEGLDGDALRARLAAALPAHLVPADVVVLDAFPLNANGKLDRRALPAPARRAAGGGAPATPTETLLARVWAEVLELDGGGQGAGVHDNFFELGGHSLLATQVVARVQQAFGVTLPVGAVFEAPTVAQLAVRVDEAVRAGVEEWEMEEALSRLDSLSDEDVAALLGDG